MKKLSILGLGILVLSVFLFLTCNDDGGSGGGSSRETIGPEGGTITSRDGKLTLTFPPGALSEDTEVTVTEIDPNDLPPEFDGLDPDLAYLLEPDGLVFAVPVTATLMLDKEPVQDDGSLSTELALLTTSSNGELEVLENLSQEVDGDAEMTTVSGELSHFSPLVDEVWGVTGSVSGVPDRLPVKGTFDALVEVVKPDTLDVLRIVPDPDNEYIDESEPPIIGLTVSHDTKELPFIHNNDRQELEGLFTYICDFIGTGTYAGGVSFTVRVERIGQMAIVTDTLLSFRKKVECVGAGPTPSPTPKPCPLSGTYSSTSAGCGINTFTLVHDEGGFLSCTNFGDNMGTVTFLGTNDPEVFTHDSPNIKILNVDGHTCVITCGPGSNQVTLTCNRPGAMCTEVFSRVF